LAGPLVAALELADPAARADASGVLRLLRLGGEELFTAALADGDARVRIEAVGALVSAGAVRAGGSGR